MPKVTIITPCYNAEKYIGQTIESVRNQTLTDWEHLVVDDGSTDGSSALVAEQAARDLRLRLIRQTNQGKCAACNRAMAAARGEYVAILDHDDLYKPQNLECKVAFLEAHPQAGMVYSDTEAIGADGELLAQAEAQRFQQRYDVGLDGYRVPIDDHDVWLFRYLVVADCIPMLTHLMRREAALEVGQFDARCWPSDDWDFWIRFSRQYEIHKIPQVLTSYRWHDSNFSRDDNRMAHARHAVYAKLRSDVTLTQDERKQLKAALHADVLEHARCCLSWGGEAVRHKKYADAARFYLRILRLRLTAATRY